MKNSFPTLEQIRVVVKEVVKDEGKTIIAAFDSELKQLEGKVNNLEDEVHKGFSDVGIRFDKVEDQIRSLDERLIVQSERLKKVEPHRFIAP